MAIDLISSFTKRQRDIRDYIKVREDGYFSSQCYKILKNRMYHLDNAVDMKLSNGKNRNQINNQWKSKITIPYAHESYLLNRAVMKRNFSSTPIISFEPLDETSWDNAVNAQQTLAQNFKSTNFRQKALNRSIKDANRWGAAVIVSFFNERTKKTMRTIEGDLGIGQEEILQKRQNVLNVVINPLNYLQNPSVPDADDSDYRGYIQRWELSRLIAISRLMKDFYIKENLKKIIEQAKDDIIENSQYNNVSPNDWHAHAVDVTHFYGTINIKGNEDSEVIYYAEMAGDEIIRFQVNPNEDDIIPISVLTLDKRGEYWWANTPVEKQLPMENWATLFMNMTADNMLNATQTYLFYPKGKIETSAINDRHKNGGFIPIDADVFREFRNVLFPFQRQEQGTSSAQYMMSEIKELSQRVSPKTDLSRQGLAGGPRNTTLGAAQLLQAEGDILQSDALTEYADGLKNVGKVNILMLQQRLDDRFSIRPSPKLQSTELHKRDILGDFEFTIESSLTKNDQSELVKYQNAVTWAMNLSGTGHPAFQNINIEALVRTVFTKFDLDMDIDEVYPPQQEQQPGQPEQVGGPPDISIEDTQGIPTGGPQLVNQQLGNVA